jgi:hypothetical protein
VFDGLLTMQVTNRPQVALTENERRALRRVAYVGGLAGGLAALAWFLPMRGQEAFTGESTIEFVVHLSALISVAVVSAAGFALWCGLVSLRFGVVKLTIAALLLGAASILYPIWRQGRPLTRQDALEVTYWAVFL